MAVGMLFASLAFLVSALLEYKMQQSSLAHNTANQLRTLNLLPCTIDVYDPNEQLMFAQIPAPVFTKNQIVTMPKSLRDILSSQKLAQVKLKYSSCSNGLNLQSELYNITMSDTNQPKTIIFYLGNDNLTKFMELPFDNKNEKTGSSQIKFFSLGIDDMGDLRAALHGAGLNFNLKVHF